MTLLTKSGLGRFFVFTDFIIAAFYHQIILLLELSRSKSSRWILFNEWRFNL